MLSTDNDTRSTRIAYSTFATSQSTDNTRSKAVTRGLFTTNVANTAMQHEYDRLFALLNERQYSAMLYAADTAAPASAGAGGSSSGGVRCI